MLSDAVPATCEPADRPPKLHSSEGGRPVAAGQGAEVPQRK